MILKEKFYERKDVLQIARELLGKYIFTSIDGFVTGGIIVETEAYNAPEDKASHAYNYRRTKRNNSLYLKGGTSYVHMCYGIHTLINIVTNKQEFPNGVLLRAIEPTDGIEKMLERRGKTKLDYTLTSGPGSLTKALGITMSHDATSLFGDTIWLEDRGNKISSENIITSKRVGVDYAEEYAAMPWRFRIKDNKWCSKGR